MKYFRTSLIILIVTIMSILLGFIRESVVVAKLGVSWQADSFNFAILLPSFLFSTMGGVISTTFLPLYTDIKINSSTKEANIFASTFMNYILIICFALVCVGEIFPEVVVKFLAPGFEGQTYALTVDLTRIVIPSLVFLGITYCLMGVLESNKDLVISSFITIPMHLAIMISLIFIYPKFGFECSMVIVLLGCVIQSLLVILKVRKWDFHYYFSFNFKNQHFIRAIKMIGPMIIGIAALQINIMVDRMLASTLESGSITAINLASKLNIASYSSIGYIIILMIFPILSEYKAKGDMLKYGQTLNKGIDIIITLMMPITVIMIFFSSEIVNILFGYGKFTQQDIRITSDILVCYSIGICALGLKDILNRGFYSLKDTVTPMKNSVISIALNIAINLCLINILKTKGIAISTSIAMIVCAMLLLNSIAKKVKSISIIKISKNAFKVGVGSFILMLTLFLIKKISIFVNIDMSSKGQIIIYIIISTLIGAIAYLVSLWLLKVECILEILKNRFSTVKNLREEI